MAKRKEFEIAGRINLTPNISEKDLKRLRKQARDVVGDVNIEGLDRGNTESQRRYNEELRKTLHYQREIRKERNLTIGDIMRESYRRDKESINLPRRSNRPLTNEERKAALLSDVELSSRTTHHAPIPIDMNKFIENRGAVAGRSYINKLGDLTVEPLQHGEAIFSELSKMKVDMKSVNDITRVIRNLQQEQSSPYTRALLPHLMNLRRYGLFDDSVYSTQLPGMESRGGTQSYNRIIEAYTRELTRAGYPVQPSRLVGGVTADYRSFQGSREWLKYMMQGGLAEQLLFDVQLPAQSLLASPSKQFSYHMLNSGVKPYIATEKAFQLAEERGLNNIPGFESIRFDPEYYYDPVNYKEVNPRHISKPGRSLAIIPNADFYNPSYIPLTTGLRRNIEGFNPEDYNPSVAAKLQEAIYPHGGSNPAWDYMTNRKLHDFDYHKYIAYSSDLDYLVRSGPTTRSQLARNMEGSLFSGDGIFSNTPSGRNRDMMYRADWFTNSRLLTTVPTYDHALKAMSGIADSINLHYQNADKFGLFEFSSMSNPNMNKYIGLSNGDIIRMLDMFTVLSRRGIPSIQQDYDISKPVPMTPGIGIDEFARPANKREYEALSRMLGDIPLFDLREGLYSLHTLQDAKYERGNLDIDDRAEMANKMANELKKIQDEEEDLRRSQSGGERLRGFKRSSGASNFFSNLDRNDPDNPDKGDPDASRANRAARKMGKPVPLPAGKQLIPTFNALPGGLFTHGNRPEMFTEEQLSLLTEKHIDTAIQQLYREINEQALAEVQSEMGRPDVPGYKVQHLARTRFNMMYARKGSGGLFDTTILQRALELAGLNVDNLLDPDTTFRGGKFKFNRNIPPHFIDEPPTYDDPEVARLHEELEMLGDESESALDELTAARKYKNSLPVGSKEIPLSSLDKRRHSEALSRINAANARREHIAKRRDEINAALEAYDYDDPRAGVGLNTPAEYDRGDITYLPSTGFEVVQGDVDPAASGSNPRFMRHENMFSNIGAKFKTLNQHNDLLKNKIIKASIPIVIAGALSTLAGISPDIAMLGMAPLMLAGVNSQEDVEKLKARLGDIKYRVSDLHVARDKPGLSQAEIDKIDGELVRLNDERNRIQDEIDDSVGATSGTGAPKGEGKTKYKWKQKSQTPSPSHGYSPEGDDITPDDLEAFKEFTPWKKGDDIYKLYGTLGYDIRGQGFPEEAAQFQEKLREELSKLDFFKQFPEELENFKAYLTSDTNFRNYDATGRAFGSIRVRGKADLRKLGGVDESVYKETAEQIDKVTKLFIGGTKANEKYAESMFVTEKATIGTGKQLNLFSEYANKVGRLSWAFTMLSMGALGVFFSMMSVNNMMMKGLNLILTPLSDLDKLMQSYAMSQAFANKTGINMADMMKEAGLNIGDVVEGWETMTGFVSSIQFGLGMLGANILKDKDTFEAIQKAVYSIVKWLSDPETAKQLGEILENLANVLPQLVKMLPSVIGFVGLMTTPFKEDAAEDDWLGNQSMFSLMLYGQIAAMFLMPILSIPALLLRLIQIGLWIAGALAVYKATGSIGQAIGWPGSQTTTGGIAGGAVAGGAVGTMSLGSLMALALAVGGGIQYGAYSLNPNYKNDDFATYMADHSPIWGWISGARPKGDPVFDYLYGTDPRMLPNNTETFGGNSTATNTLATYNIFDDPINQQLMNADLSNIQVSNSLLSNMTDYNFDAMGQNYAENISMMKKETEELEPLIAAFNGNTTFEGFQRESGASNITFKQEIHNEIIVQGSLDEKSTPNLLDGIASIFAGRW